MTAINRLALSLTVIFLISGGVPIDGFILRASAQAQSPAASPAAPGAMVQPAPPMGMMPEMHGPQGMGPMGNPMWIHHHCHRRMPIVVAIVGSIVGLSMAFAFFALGMFLLRRSHPPHST